MLEHLADVSIRSLPIALFSALVLWIIRSRGNAALQHAVWTGVVCGMLALFAFGQALPRLPLRILDRPAVATRTVEQAAQPMLFDALPEERQLPNPVPSIPRHQIDWSGVAVYAYCAVALAFLAQLFTGIFLVRKLFASGTPIQNGVYESEAITVPLTAGWLHPRVLLPLEWREWDRAKLDAVLAHEGAHARRHDGLVALMAGLNRCLFWFHPLAWILERKLALLAEQACDESCVVTLGDPDRYARLLLEMASVVEGSKGRLRYHALTMAASSHMKQRIDSLLREGRTFSRGLTWTGWAAVMLCCIPAVLAAGAVELDRQPALLQLEMPRWNLPAPPVMIAQARSIPTAPAPSEPTPKFDVATVKPCNPNDDAGRGGRGGPGSGGGGGYFGWSPGRLWVTCMRVSDLIEIAYVQFGDNSLVNDSKMPMFSERIRGGPAWAHSDRYSVNAETEDPVAKGPTSGSSPAVRMMAGSMLQALLEDRFQLKTHRAMEETAMYALTVAKGGLKLKPMEEGGCIPIEPGKPLPPRIDGKPYCGWIGWGTNGPNKTAIGGGVKLERFAQALGDLFMDRHVIDKTGVGGVFNINVEYAPDENTPNTLVDPSRPVDTTSDIPLGVSIFTALEQQLGLKLEPIKGPRGYIVIDRVERPSEN